MIFRNKYFMNASLIALLLILFPKVYAETKQTIQEFTQEKPIVNLTAKNPTFIIKLKSNPTTGYSWFLRDYNISIIDPIGHKYQSPDKKLIGAPGYELWTFRAKPAAFKVPQQTLIRFVYARPWESSDSSTQLVFQNGILTGLK